MATEYIKTTYKKYWDTFDDEGNLTSSIGLKHPDTLTFIHNEATGEHTLMTRSQGTLIKGIPDVPEDISDSPKNATLTSDGMSFGWKEDEYIVSMSWPNNPVDNSTIIIKGDKNVILDKIHAALIRADENEEPRVVYELGMPNFNVTKEPRKIPCKIISSEVVGSTYIDVRFYILKDQIIKDVKTHLPTYWNGYFNILNSEGEVQIPGAAQLFEYISTDDLGVLYRCTYYAPQAEIYGYDPDGYIETDAAVIDGTIGEVVVLFPELYYRSKQDDYMNTIEFCLNPRNSAEWTKSDLIGMYPWMCVQSSVVEDQTSISPYREIVDIAIEDRAYSVPVNWEGFSYTPRFELIDPTQYTSQDKQFYEDKISHNITYTEYRAFYWLYRLAIESLSIDTMTISNNEGFSVMTPLSMDAGVEDILTSSYCPRQDVWTESDKHTGLDYYIKAIRPDRLELFYSESQLSYEKDTYMPVFCGIQAPFTGIPFSLWGVRVEQTRVLNRDSHISRGVDGKWFVYSTGKNVNGSVVYEEGNLVYVPICIPNEYRNSYTAVLQVNLGRSADLFPSVYNNTWGNLQTQYFMYYIDLYELSRDTPTDDQSLISAGIRVNDWTYCTSDIDIISSTDSYQLSTPYPIESGIIKTLKKQPVY